MNFDELELERAEAHQHMHRELHDHRLKNDVQYAQRNQLIRRDFIQRDRRFAEVPVLPTGFGDMP